MFHAFFFHFRQKLKGRPFPAWINETLFEERLLGMLRVDLDFTQYETLERKRLKGGELDQKRLFKKV